MKFMMVLDQSRVQGEGGLHEPHFVKSPDWDTEGLSPREQDHHLHAQKLTLRATCDLSNEWR
jgi:hypothetical protein